MNKGGHWGILTGLCLEQAFGCITLSIEMDDLIINFAQIIKNPYLRNGRRHNIAAFVGFTNISFVNLDMSVLRRKFEEPFKFSGRGRDSGTGPIFCRTRRFL